MKPVLVVCHGNYMRSPAAAAVMRAHGIKVVSAGFHPHNRNASPRMCRAMAARGYAVGEHRPQAVTVELVRGAALVLMMDRSNLHHLLAVIRGAVPTTVTPAMYLGHWAGVKWIKDPAYCAQDSPMFAEIADTLVKASVAFSEWWQLNREKGTHEWQMPEYNPGS